jgi:AraC-like DNA-binding protein
VSAYVRALRTLEAVDLLTEANHWRCSLTGIAEASGFTNLQAMRRAVKETMGSSLKAVQENPQELRFRAAQLRRLTGQ